MNDLTLFLFERESICVYGEIVGLPYYIGGEITSTEAVCADG